MVKEEEIQKAIAEEKKRLKDLITAAEKSIKSFEDRISTQLREKHDAIKDIEASLETAKKPYDGAISLMNVLMDDVLIKKHKMQIEMNRVDYLVRATFSKELLEFPDADSLKGYFLWKGIELPDVEMIKKKLPNGVMLFRVYVNYHLASTNKSSSSKSHQVAYLAIKGKEAIGYIFTKKSQHPGDYAKVYCWINSRLLRDSTQLSKNEYSANPSVGFKKWKQMISELKEFVPINLDDEKNQKVFEFINRFVDHDALKD